MSERRTLFYTVVVERSGEETFTQTTCERCGYVVPEEADDVVTFVGIQNASPDRIKEVMERLEAAKRSEKRTVIYDVDETTINHNGRPMRRVMIEHAMRCPKNPAL